MTAHPLTLPRAFAAIAAAAASAFAVEMALPAETARLIDSPMAGYKTAQSLCMTCHSADYIRMQPPSMTRAIWRANIVKMQKTFGAPIPDAAIDPIAEYLAKTYGAERVGSPSPAGGP